MIKNIINGTNNIFRTKDSKIGKRKTITYDNIKPFRAKYAEYAGAL